MTCTGGAPTFSGSTSGTHPEVALMFWGGWPTSWVPNKGQVIGSVQALLHGPYYAPLNQYGNLGLPRMSPMTITHNATIPTNYTTTDIQNAINAEIAKGTLPKPGNGADMIYGVMMPPNTFSTSIANPAPPGYNAFGKYTDGTQYKYFFVSGTGSLTGYASYMHVFTHELAEAMTLGFKVTNCGVNNNQIGDLCQCLTEDQLNGQMTVGAYWSRKDNECVLPESWSGIYQYLGTPGNWELIGTAGRQVESGPYGIVATDVNDNSFFYTHSTVSWTAIGGPGAMFSVGSRGLIAMTPDATAVAIWNGQWSFVGNAASSVYAGGASSGPTGNSFYNTDYAGNPYIYLGSSNWGSMGGRGDEFVATSSWLARLSSDHTQVALWNGGTSWQNIAGARSSIFGSSGSNVIGGLTPDATKNVGIWSLSSDFIPQGGPGADFAMVGTSSGQQLYGVTPDDSAVWQSTNLAATNPPWTQVGGAAARVMGGDTLYATLGVNY